MTLPCLDPCTVTTDTAVNYKEAQPQPTKCKPRHRHKGEKLGGFEHKTFGVHCRGTLLGLSLSEILWTGSVLDQDPFRGSVCSPSCEGCQCSTPPQHLEDEQLLSSGELGQDLYRGMAVRARVSGSKVQFLAMDVQAQQVIVVTQFASVGTTLKLPTERSDRF